MITKIALSLLTVALFASCESTQTADRGTLESRALAANTGSIDEPAPPAEGPEDVPAEGPMDPNRNPALLPTPLLRESAAAGL